MSVFTKLFNINTISKEEFPLNTSIVQYDKKNRMATYVIDRGDRTFKLEVTLSSKTEWKGQLLQIRPRNKSELYLFDSKEHLENLIKNEKFR